MWPYNRMTGHLQTIQNILRHIHRDQTYQRLSNIWSSQVQKDDCGHHILLIGAQGLVVSHRLSISVWISTMGKQMLCYKCLWPWSSWILNVLIISQKVPSCWLGSYTRPSSFTELIHFLLETRQIWRLTWVESWERGVYTVSLRTIWNKIDLFFFQNVSGHLLVSYSPGITLWSSFQGWTRPFQDHPWFAGDSQSLELWEILQFCCRSVFQTWQC